MTVGQVMGWFDYDLLQVSVDVDEWLEQEEQGRKQQELAQKQLVVTGEDHIPKQYTVWGKTPEGLLVAGTQSSAQTVILVGAVGTGKTQGSTLMREGAHLPELAGVTTMGERVRTVTLMPDCHKGQGRIPLLCGLYPNPYPEQWQVLRQVYGVRLAEALAAFPYVNIAVLPGKSQRYRERYPELVEAGRFRLHEIGFHQEEQTAFFYRLLLSVGTEGGGKVRTQSRAVLDSIIANLGVGRDPERVLAEFKRAKLQGVGAVSEQIKFIRLLTSKNGRHLIDFLEDPMPWAVLLESEDLGPGQILPLEIAMLAALSKRLRSGGNPLRWYIFHEMVKQLLHDIVAPYLIERGAEVRHDVCSHLFETQEIQFMPKALVSLATGIIHSRGVSPEDYHRVQALFQSFRGVPFPVIGGLPDREAYFGFQRVSDPLLRGRAFRVRLRPSAVWAGGETIRVG